MDDEIDATVRAFKEPLIYHLLTAGVLVHTVDELTPENWKILNEARDGLNNAFLAFMEMSAWQRGGEHD